MLGSRGRIYWNQNLAYSDSLLSISKIFWLQKIHMNSPKIVFKYWDKENSPEKKILKFVNKSILTIALSKNMINIPLGIPF